jgi:hypothetical protein
MCVTYEAIVRNAIVTKEQHEDIKQTTNQKVSAEFDVH